MPARTSRIAAQAIAAAATAVAVAFAILLPAAAFAQDAPWKTFTRPALGLSMQRPADLYEIEPEAPADDVTGEVEWGPTDHAWSILVTSQALKDGQTLSSIVADEKSRNPRIEAEDLKIGGSVDAQRIVWLDEDALSVLVLLLDRSGTKLIAIQLSINLTEDDSDKDVAALRITYNGSLKLFARMIETVRIAKN
jgi:hypothetical protein